MTKSQTPPALGIERKSRCTRLVIPGDDTIIDSTCPWHREKEQMHKTSYTRRWHNHRLHLPLALRERDAQDQSYQEMTQSQTPPTLGIERKSRCTRPVIPGDDTITDSTNPWHWEKEQMHKTTYSRRWHNHRLHLPLALRADAQDQSYQEMTQSQTPPTLGTERKNRCTRPVIPGDDTITDSTYPWHWQSRCTKLVIPGDDTITDSTNLWHKEKEQMHKTSHTR